MGPGNPLKRGDKGSGKGFLWKVKTTCLGRGKKLMQALTRPKQVKTVERHGKTIKFKGGEGGT